LPLMNDITMTWPFIALMMEAVGTSETSVYSTRLHGATSQKTLNFIIAAVITWNFSEWIYITYIINSVRHSESWWSMSVMDVLLPVARSHSSPPARTGIMLGRVYRCSWIVQQDLCESCPYRKSKATKGILTGRLLHHGGVKRSVVSYPQMALAFRVSFITFEILH
jgi:hypothetical protein